jgi:hypothetical protein
MCASAHYQKPIDGVHFTKTGIPEALQPGLGIVKSQTWPEGRIFECNSWFNGSCFGGKNRGFLKEGVKADI